jgi:hypothetical protein
MTMLIVALVAMDAVLWLWARNHIRAIREGRKPRQNGW